MAVQETFLLMAVDISLEELLEAGCHFGHQTRRWDPRMAPYIYSAREGVHVFDLAKTRESLLATCEKIEETAAAGGVILFVGTKRQARDLVRDAAVKVGMPYVITRWLGGTLTNFEQVKRSLKKLLDLKSGLASGKFNDYTKKERLLMEREMMRLEHLFGGLTGLHAAPALLFIVDTHKETAAVAEANRLGIPIAGIVDTNANPTLVDYPIPANDDAVKSVSTILDLVIEAIETGKKKYEAGKPVTTEVAA